VKQNRPGHGSSSKIFKSTFRGKIRSLLEEDKFLCPDFF
jgi:hypothetical protein